MYKPKTIDAEEWRKIMIIVINEVEHMNDDVFEDFIDTLESFRPINEGEVHYELRGKLC